MNAIAERFVLSIKRECLSRLILFGTRHLERAYARVRRAIITPNARIKGWATS
jgi:hypothetical protein